MRVLNTGTEVEAAVADALVTPCFSFFNTFHPSAPVSQAFGFQSTDWTVEKLHETQEWLREGTSWLRFEMFLLDGW